MEQAEAHAVARGGAVGEQRLVGEREERPAQRGVNAELVVGPLDRGERAEHGLHLLAIVKAPPAHEHVRDAPRLQRPHVGAGEVVPVALKTLEKKANMPRLQGHAHALGVALAHRPPALVDEPVDERAHGVGERSGDGVGGDLAPLAVGSRDRERDDRRLIGDLAAVAPSAT